MVFICLFETEFWASQADLKLSVNLTLSLMSWSSCLRLSSVGVWSATPDLAGGFGKGLSRESVVSVSAVWLSSFGGGEYQ